MSDSEIKNYIEPHTIFINKLNPNAYIEELSEMEKDPETVGINLYSIDHVYCVSGKRTIVPTGISINIPRGYFGRIEPRNYKMEKDGLVALPSIITHQLHQPEIKVVILNCSSSDYHLYPKECIAQLVLYQTPTIKYIHVET